MYSEVGRPTTDPVNLIKLAFIQYTFDNSLNSYVTGIS